MNYIRDFINDRIVQLNFEFLLFGFNFHQFPGRHKNGSFADIADPIRHPFEIVSHPHDQIGVINDLGFFRSLSQQLNEGSYCKLDPLYHLQQEWSWQ